MAADGKNWAQGINLANALSVRLRESGAPDSLTARTVISADADSHVRAIIFRDADEP